MLLNHCSDFDLDSQHHWLNAASEGPIPLISKKALEEAIYWKLSPERLTIPMFQRVPLELKRSLANLLNVNYVDIILGNSATYGLHLLANGLPLASGDDVMVMQNDFPTDILPWLSLKERNITVRQIPSTSTVLTVDEISESVQKTTKVICLPMIHSFSGHMIDYVKIGNLCREKNILFIVNISQAAGVIPLDLNTLPIDAVVCAGYKWLLGPYGTGFCWMKESVRQSLNYPHNYWISLMDEASLMGEGDLSLNNDRSSRRYDVFGTANFFNYVPWKTSIDYLMGIGVTNIQSHNQVLMKQFIQGVDKNRFRFISPLNYSSPIGVFTYFDSKQNKRIYDFLLSKNFHLAFWKNNLRISPHIYNQQASIDQLLGALNEFKH